MGLHFDELAIRPYVNHFRLLEYRLAIIRRLMKMSCSRGPILSVWVALLRAEDEAGHWSRR